MSGTRTRRCRCRTRFGLDPKETSYENPLDPKIRKHFWMRTQKIRKHFGSKHMKTFPKDTKTFWMRTQKAKDTKTFRMPKIRKPKRSVCPSTPPAPPLHRPPTMAAAADLIASQPIAHGLTVMPRRSWRKKTYLAQSLIDFVLHLHDDHSPRQ